MRRARTIQGPIQDEVERTMACLDGLERLEAGPDFLARVRRRVAGEDRQPVPTPWRRPFFAPLLRPALLAVLILANLFTIVLVARAGRTRDAARAASVQAVASDYALTQDLDDLYGATEETGK